MSLVAAKCTSCGANIEVNPTSEAGICKYCGSPFITQKAIVNYNTTIVNNTTINTNSVNILSGDFNNLMTNAIDSWESGDYEDAYNKFLKALELNPNDCSALLYKSLCIAVLKENMLAPCKTFNNIILDETCPLNIEEQKFFITCLNNIACNEFKNIFNNFTTEFDGMDYIENAWNHLENLLECQKVIILCAKKIVNKDNTFTSELITHKKNIVCTYKALCDKWKRLMPLDYRYHVKEYHPNKSKYEEELKNVENKIKELDPNYITETSSGGCYIATCVYGSYNCPEVWTLRRYRDYTLSNSWYGRLFINIYYKTSPTLVKIFGNKNWFKKMWKSKLDKMVKNLNEKGLENTPYEDIDYTKSRNKNKA